MSLLWPSQQLQSVKNRFLRIVFYNPFFFLCLFRSSSDFLVDFTVLCRRTGLAIFSSFLEFRLLSRNISRISLVIHGFFFFPALPNYFVSYKPLILWLRPKANNLTTTPTPCSKNTQKTAISRFIWLGVPGCCCCCCWWWWWINSFYSSPYFYGCGVIVGMPSEKGEFFGWI